MYKFIDLDTGLPAALNKIKTWVNTKLATKQDALVSGTNIKTVGGVSLLGSGDVPVSTASSSVSVLFVGNSLTQDAVSYLPLVLKEIAPNLTFNFYMWYDGGYTLTQILNKWNNSGKAEIFSVCENVTSWTNYNNSKTIANVLADYDFDIVSLEEYFNYKRANGYTAEDKQVFNDIIAYLRTNYDKAFKVVSFFHRPLVKNPSTNVADLAIADEVFGLTYDGVRWQLENTISESVIPTGIAAYRAMRDTTLNGLGSFGYMSYEGTHSQEGLPCMMQAWCCAMWLLDKLGIPVSINNSQTRVTSSNYSSINVPGPNGSVVVGTTAQDREAMDVAIKAYKEGKRLEMDFISPNGVPAYKINVAGGSGTRNERTVKLYASVVPADAAELIEWSIVSGEATVNNGLVTYNGSAKTASVVVRAMLAGKNLKTDTTLSFSLDSVEAPVFSPVAGEYGFGQPVTISCATSGATIFYTTDGSTPTAASTQYTTPVTINDAITIKAIAILGNEQSSVASASYTVATPKTVTINVTDGVNAITGASVVLNDGTNDFSPVSQEAGSYVFSVMPCTYTLSVSADGYIDNTSEIMVTGNMTETVVMAEVQRTNMLAHATLYNGFNVYGDLANLYCSTGSAYSQRASVLVANEYCDGKTTTWRSNGNAKPGYSGPPVPDGATRIEIKMTNPNCVATVYATKSDRFCTASSSFALSSAATLTITPSQWSGLQNLQFSFRPASGTWTNTTIEGLGLTCYAYYD